MTIFVYLIFHAYSYCYFSAPELYCTLGLCAPAPPCNVQSATAYCIPNIEFQDELHSDCISLCTGDTVQSFYQSTIKVMLSVQVVMHGSGQRLSIALSHIL